MKIDNIKKAAEIIKTLEGLYKCSNPPMSVHQDTSIKYGGYSVDIPQDKAEAFIKQLIIDFKKELRDMGAE